MILAQEVFKTSLFGRKTIVLCVQGSGNPVTEHSGLGAYIEFGSSRRRFCLWQALGKLSKDEAEISAVGLSIERILEIDRKDDLNMFEVLHIVSDSTYTRTSLLGGHTIRKESKRQQKPLSLLKSAAKKWKIK